MTHYLLTLEGDAARDGVKEVSSMRALCICIAGAIAYNHMAEKKTKPTGACDTGGLTHSLSRRL